MKIVKDVEVEIESLRKTQTDKTENENLGRQTRTLEISLTNRIQDMEGRILGIEDNVEEIDTSVK